MQLALAAKRSKGIHIKVQKKNENKRYASWTGLKSGFNVSKNGKMNEINSCKFNSSSAQSALIECNILCSASLMLQMQMFTFEAFMEIPFNEYTSPITIPIK